MDNIENVSNNDNAKNCLCADCGKDLSYENNVHKMSRHKLDGTLETVTVCDDCYNKHIELDKQKIELDKEKAIFVSNTKRRQYTNCLTWAIIFAILFLVEH